MALAVILGGGARIGIVMLRALPVWGRHEKQERTRAES